MRALLKQFKHLMAAVQIYNMYSYEKNFRTLDVVPEKIVLK